MPPPWQVERQSKKEKWKFVLQNKILCDVNFKVGSEMEIICCHRIILVLHSPVFEAMFSERWNTGKEIILPDVDLRAFQLFLEFLYTEAFPSSNPDILPLLYIARKYDVLELVNKCLEYFNSSGITVENALFIYQQSRIFAEDSIEKLAIDFICRNAQEIVESDGFLDLSHTNLCNLLINDELKINELNLFKAVYRWAEAECVKQNLEGTSKNIRDSLDVALYLIRFPQMNARDFTMHVVNKGILSTEEIVQIYSHISLHETEWCQLPKNNFIVNARTLPMIFTVKSLILEPTSLSNIFGSVWHHLSFQVDRTIKIVSFSFYGPEFANSVLDTHIRLQDYDLTYTLATWKQTIFLDTVRDIFQISFNTPVEIRENVLYTASFLLKGCRLWHGPIDIVRRETVRTVSCGRKGDVNFIFQDAKCGYTTRGQLPEINFTL